MMLSVQYSQWAALSAMRTAIFIMSARFSISPAKASAPI